MMLPARLSAVLFDLDGTLVDSLPVLRQVYAEFVASRGGQPSDDEFERLNGPSLPEIAAALRTAHGWEATELELEADYRAAIVAAYADQVGPMPSAAAVIAAARSAGMATAVVTAGTQPAVMPLLRRLGWEAAFSTIVTAEHVRRAKPAPDLYLAALDRLGVVATDALAVEDSKNGVAAAKAAGLAVLDLGENPAGLALLADALARTVAAIPPETGQL